jgi:hypothetical protein
VRIACSGAIAVGTGEWRRIKGRRGEEGEKVDEREEKDEMEKNGRRRKGG